MILSNLKGCSILIEFQLILAPGITCLYIIYQTQGLPNLLNSFVYNVYPARRSGKRIHCKLYSSIKDALATVWSLSSWSFTTKYDTNIVQIQIQCKYKYSLVAALMRRSGFYQKARKAEDSWWLGMARKKNTHKIKAGVGIIKG